MTSIRFNQANFQLPLSMSFDHCICGLQQLGHEDDEGHFAGFSTMRNWSFLALRLGFRRAAIRADM
jgi:hypothetical protein